MRAMFTWCRERLGIVETKQNRRMLKKKKDVIKKETNRRGRRAGH